MSIAKMPRRTHRADVSETPEVATPSLLFQPQTEAPDLGEETRSHEAAESRVTRDAEAPDAGSGRSFCWESEFTHGRSRS